MSTAADLLVSQSIRSRATDLRAAADRCLSAYTTGPLCDAASHLAAAYLDAARLLERRAWQWERGERDRPEGP